MSLPSRVAIGDVYGRLTVIYELPERRFGGRVWWCRCECGNEKAIRAHRLVEGTTCSCGCYQRESTRERSLRHGYARVGGTPTYRSWVGMLNRCRLPNTVGFKRYGGRGITVCERWKDFMNFLADMGERPAGTTLDRIDSNENYAPDNCRWATWKQQGFNKLSTHRFAGIDGNELCLRDVAHYLAIPRTTFRRKLHALGVIA